VLRFRDVENIVLEKSAITIGTAIALTVASNESRTPQPLLVGEVTALEKEHDSTGTFTIVRGLDRSHRLTRGRRVVGFQEKPAEPRSTLIAVGLYYFPRATLPLVRTYLDLGSGKDAPGYYLQWLHRRIPVYGHVLDGEWFDIGDLDSYHRADEAVKRKEAS
jgi:NDP-sugar pyrophosphorylase family protein